MLGYVRRCGGMLGYVGLHEGMWGSVGYVGLCGDMWGYVGIRAGKQLHFNIQLCVNYRHCIHSKSVFIGSFKASRPIVCNKLLLKTVAV